MAVPIGEEATAFHGVVALSASAAFLLNSLNEPHTANELIEILLKEYDVDRETAEKDIKEIVPKLIRIAEENYLGTDLKPAVVDGFSRRVLVSENEENRTYVMRVIDETVEEDAYIGSLQTIDRYGNVIKLSYVDAQDNAAIGPEGCSTVTREYTSRGQVARELYFDGNDVPFSVDGVYGVKKEYSAFAKLIKETWLDADGNAATTKDGYASSLWTAASLWAPVTGT